MINFLISLFVLSLYPQHKPRLIKKSEQTKLEYFLNSKLTSDPFSTYLNKPNTDHNTPLNSKPQLNHNTAFITFHRQINKHPTKQA